MNIYTKTGDEGTTTILGNKVSKNDHLIEAIGSLDEFNSIIGIVKCFIKKDAILLGRIEEIQINLMVIGSELGSLKPNKNISEKNVLRLEDSIDKFEKLIPELKNFILPGGTELSSYLFYSRSMCRNLERKLIYLTIENKFILQYINRLSDFLFVLGRVENHYNGTGDVIWKT